MEPTEASTYQEPSELERLMKAAQVYLGELRVVRIEISGQRGGD